MKSIKYDVENEIIIRKSKFITKLYKIYDICKFNNILNELKKQYKDSTHICYAYIIGNEKRFNDDNEPSKTAGMPILKVLENNNLNNVLCVVIRYFGGIKLGAGGLIRAYSTSASEALNKTEIIDLIKAKKVEITFTYDNVKKIDNILKSTNIENKSFNELIKYNFIIKESEFDETINKLNDLCNSIHIKEDTFL